MASTPTILVAALFALAGCVSTVHPTPVASCAPQADGTRPTHGALEVLPSDEPELVLDSMRWSVSTESNPPFVSQTMLYMGGRITSTREVPLSGIGVLFEGERNSQVVFRRLVDRFVIPRPVPGFEHSVSTIVAMQRVTPERPVPATVGETNFSADAPVGWGCPTRVRLIREMELARHIGLVDRLALDTARLLAERRAAHGALEPVEILFDTLYLKPPAQPLLIGVAVNTTARVIQNAAVWIAVDRPPASGGPDTLSFPLGELRPHALAAFGGGSVSAADGRRARGVWLEARDGPRVTALYAHSVAAYRRANNGQVKPPVLAADESPGSQFYPWNPATFDIDSVLATRRPVYALLHGPSATSERAELVIVLSKVLYRRHSSGRVYADSSRMSWPEMDSVFTGARGLARVRSVPPQMAGRPITAEDSAMRVLQPNAGEDVLVFQSGGGSVRRVKFPAGQAPAEAKVLFDALMRIERLSGARARLASSP